VLAVTKANPPDTAFVFHTSSTCNADLPSASAKIFVDNRVTLRIKTYTVLNGNELSTSDRATLESINFSQIERFVTQDYIPDQTAGQQTNKLEQS